MLIGRLHAVLGLARPQRFTLLAAISALVVGITSLCQPAWGVVNGDFATGNTTGWTEIAFDDDDNAVAPPISVIMDGAGHFAQLETVPYSGSESFFPVTVLSQSFTLTSDILRFDLGFDTEVDLNEAVDPLAFPDSFEVSLFDGTDSFTLALFDTFGLSVDPFGDVANAGAGNLISSPSSHPALTGHVQFNINLAALSSQDVILDVVMLNDLDGFASVGQITNVVNPGPVDGIPEPLTATLGLMGLGGLGMTLFRRQRIAITESLDQPGV